MNGDDLGPPHASAMNYVSLAIIIGIAVLTIAGYSALVLLSEPMRFP